MAKIKNFSLRALASLGKALTFSTWKGIPVVKAHTSKRGTPQSEKVLRNNRRFYIAALALRAMDKTMIVHWKEWAKGSTYTWKDLFMAMYLRYWSKFNQAPIIVRKVTYTRIEDALVCCVWMGNYFALRGEGYGTLAYGSSPYGHREKFYQRYGWPLNRDMIVLKSAVPKQRWEPGNSPADADTLE